jgi:hypothetical protein
MNGWMWSAAERATERCNTMYNLRLRSMLCVHVSLFRPSLRASESVNISCCIDAGHSNTTNPLARTKLVFSLAGVRVVEKVGS